MLFEVEDLAVASPATVSRCGMVFNDIVDLGWQPYVDSWLNRRQDKVRKKQSKMISYTMWGYKGLLWNQNGVKN